MVMAHKTDHNNSESFCLPPHL